MASRDSLNRSKVFGSVNDDANLHPIFTSAFPTDTSGHIKEITPTFSFRQRIDNVLLLQPGPPLKICPSRLNYNDVKHLLEYHQSRLEQLSLEAALPSGWKADRHLKVPTVRVSDTTINSQIETQNSILLFASLPIFYYIPFTPPPSSLEASVPSASSYNTAFEFQASRSPFYASPTISEQQTQAGEEENTLLLCFDLRTMEFLFLRVEIPLRHAGSPEKLQDIIASVMLEPGQFSSKEVYQQDYLSAITLFRVPLHHVRATIIGTDNHRGRDAWFNDWKESISFKTGVIYLMGQFMDDFSIGNMALNSTERAEVGSSEYDLKTWGHRLRIFRELGDGWLEREKK